MHGFQLTSEMTGEAVVEVARQQNAVLKVFGRFSLRVQQPLYALDNRVATGQKDIEKIDVCLKRHLEPRSDAHRVIVRGCFCAAIRGRETAL